MVGRKDLGAAHSGLEDWYWQRLSAVLLALLLPLPLALLFLLLFGHIDQFILLDFLDHPLTRTLHSLLSLALLLHAYIGVKVIAEDYVPMAWRLPLLALLQVAAAATGLGWLAIIWAWGG